MIDSPLVQSFLRSALAPAIGVGVAIFLSGGMKEMWRSRFQAFVFALGFVAGAYMLVGRLSIPPSDGAEGFSLAALALALLVVWHPRPLGPRYLLRGLFVLIVGALLLWPMRQTLMSPTYHRNILAFFCLGLGLWSITERAAGYVKPVTLFALPLVTIAAASGMLVLKGSALYSNMAATLAALVGACAVLGLIFPARISVRALVPFVSVFVVLFLTAGLFYLDINPWWLIALAGPYLLLWIREWLSFIPNTPWIEAPTLAIVAAAPLGYFLYQIFLTAGPLY